MTSTFDFIRNTIRDAEDDIILRELIKEVFVFASSNLWNTSNEPDCWYYTKYKGRKQSIDFTLDEWERYFDDLHDVDHETGHRVFPPRNITALDQLEKMLTEEIIFKKYNLTTLFKYCKKAIGYFDTHFVRTPPFWSRKGTYFDRGS